MLSRLESGGLTPAAALASHAEVSHRKGTAARRPRTLLIAEAANPALTSAALVGWYCAKALAEVSDAHIVTEERNREHFIAAGLKEGVDFTAINARRSQGMAWRIASWLRGGQDLGWTTYSAMAILAYPFFEKALWRQFKPQLLAGEFDLVHRILPLSPMAPSWIASKLARHRIPFIVGPLNGGVPWPKPFAHLQAQEKEWAGKLRGLAKWLPGAQATRSKSAALIAASRTTWREIGVRHHHKTFFIPENAIDLARFPAVQKPKAQTPLRVAFVGRLVPLKGVDMLIEAAAPLLKGGQLELDLIGDGPEKGRLGELAARLGVSEQVRLDGWVPHAQLADRLKTAQVFAFPSVREFGGGAVIEAMALGLVPVVLDHGGPVELVPSHTGYVIPMMERSAIVERLRELFASLIADPSPLDAFSLQAQEHIRRYYTWEAKAAQILEVYEWVLGRREQKPDWGMPFGFPA